MSLTLEMARKSPLRTWRGNDPRERALNSAAMRLLAIALNMTSCGLPQNPLVRWPVPGRYQAWPMVESTFESRGCSERVRFYVCPKAAILSDDDPFPVGTILVVETIPLDARERRPPARFVMGKYVGVTTGRPNLASYGAWAFASYGPAGDVLSTNGFACGLCRVP